MTPLGHRFRGDGTWRTADPEAAGCISHNRRMRRLLPPPTVLPSRPALSPAGGARRQALTLALAALLQPLAAAAVPAPITVEVERDGDRFSILARADLAADARSAWDTLTDYPRLSQFVPGINRTRVLARSGRAGGEERLTVEYLGRFKLLFLTLPTQLWLDVQHQPFTDVIAQSAARVPDGAAPTLTAFRARYALAVVGGGHAGAAPRVRLEYSAQFTLAEPLPPVIGPLFGTSAVRAAVREQFAAMVAEIERRARQRPSIEAGKAG